MRFLDAGETHGKALIAIVEGFPAHVKIDIENINRLLQLRQRGYGRGKRMEIEKDGVIFLSGVRNSYTTGAPITLMIENRDYENWKDFMDAIQCDLETKKVTVPRPGHADLAGCLKYGFDDARNILERASARETAIRVAVGAICEELLKMFGIKFYNHVVEIGKVRLTKSYSTDNIDLFEKALSSSELFCIDEETENRMKQEIDIAKQMGDSVGGVAEVICKNVPYGLGSHVHWDRKLDALIAQAVMSIQSVKGVEIGMGFEAARRFGSEVHDEIYYDGERSFYRKTNNAGGIEGGISNGMDIVVRAAFKPIPTLYKPLKSVDIQTFQPAEAAVERSDICAVPAGSVVMRAAIAYVLANALIERLGGDSVKTMLETFKRIYNK
ncbi:chorismate synthase [Caldicellulosiruptor owensensis OL]|uniref:Chorismate synthase n=1 Tax=Caldicellulosiruptor owensensis (strain ATCC 700167 / DSM 13100 / OL) TaxID=632518 RepID=E4Q174_CALOW|nr:chorismate synthase [Caldicellulosiruptor owensensis]ADQ04633.1 chorismate synthase [Caldicellulosiruptor owensensis OL]